MIVIILLQIPNYKLGKPVSLSFLYLYICVRIRRLIELIHLAFSENQFPIIMISSSPTALVTMHNVKRFLQEAVFEPSQEARTRAAAEGNARPEDMIPIYRKRTTIDSSGREVETHTRYFVVDSTEALAKFGADAWDRVVCVMTTGQAWQFKPYKWSEPLTLFHHGQSLNKLCFAKQ